MEKGTRDGSVMKRKRNREAARKVLDILEEKARQQIQCSEQLQNTMKGICNRLAVIQKLMESASGGSDKLTADKKSREGQSENLPFVGNASGKRFGGEGQSATHEVMPSGAMPTIAVFNVTVQTDFTSVQDLQRLGDISAMRAMMEQSGMSVPFQQTTNPSNQVPPLTREMIQDDAAGGGAADPASSPADAALKKAKTCRCDTSPGNVCSGKPKAEPGQPSAAPGPMHSAVTVAQKDTRAGEPQEFSDKELENVFDEEEIPDVQLDPNERLFMTEFPELNQDFEPKREYPLPYTPLQNYPGGWEPPVFSDEELEKAFEEEVIESVELGPNERLFMLEFKDLVGDWTPTDYPAPKSAAAGLPASVSNVAAPGGRMQTATTCGCGGAGFVMRQCPMKRNIQSGGEAGISPSQQGTPPGKKFCLCAEKSALVTSGKPTGDVISAVTLAQKPTSGGGQPQEFSDKDLENVFDEEEIADVELGPNERLFMTEYPELNKKFEPDRDYPLPYTPVQNYPGGWNPPVFTDEELQAAFDEEEIPAVDLQPNERLFMLEFRDLAGDWDPNTAAVTARQMQTPTSAYSGVTVPPQFSTATAGQVCCVCGKIQRGIINGEKPSGSSQPSMKGGPAVSGVTVAQKATGGGEPQEFSDKDLENVFDEEEIADVELGPNERLFMTEYPELDKKFEPDREYPLPYTPVQNYPGGWNPPVFTDEELQTAFDEEEIPAVDLQPNERLFMLEFKDLVGDWSPSTSPAMTQISGVKTIATIPSVGGAPTTGFEICCTCGKLKRI